MIVVHCACGEVYQIADDKAGYSLICAKCKRVIDLAAPNKNTPRPSKLRRSQGSILFAVLLILVALVSYNLNPSHQNPAASAENKPQQTNAFHAVPTTQPKLVPAQPAASEPQRTTSAAYIPTAKDEAEINRQAKLATVPPISNLKLMPAPPMNADTSLATGTNITPPVGTSGRGTLTVINGNSQDAVIKLVGADSGLSPNLTYRHVYIKAHEQMTLQNISAGGYTLLYKIGTNWDGQGSFSEGERTYKFGKTLDFKEDTTAADSGGREMHWSEMTVTLHPEIAGNVKAKEISKEDFARPQ